MLAEPIMILTMCVNQTITLHGLNSYGDVGQLFLNEIGGKRKRFASHSPLFGGY